MGRPRYGSTRIPNTTAIRVNPETKSIILQIYRQFVHGDSTMPIGDKLETVLKLMQKKEEALEGEIRRLDGLLTDIERLWGENKPLVIAK